MGGTSSQQQTQQSVSQPWAPAQPALEGMLGQLQNNLGNTGITNNESSALGHLVENAGSAGQWAAPIQSYAQNLLGGGGANDQAANVNQNYQRYANQTNPLASNTNYNPYDTPGLKDALSTLTGDITNQVNGSFAAGGRDFSGANQMALGRGLTQGLAPALLGQYNQNIQNQQGAAGNLYNAGNTNAGLLTGLQQQHLANQGQGVQAAGQAMDAANATSNATLQAEAARRGIPVQALGLLAQIGIPIAGLGGQTSGTSTGSKTMSGAEQFGMIGGTAAKLLPFWPSDRRLKEDIAQVGTLFDGTPVYRYRYIGHTAFQIGLMAQDIEQVTPEAVAELGDYKMVDYKLATNKALEVA